MGWACSTYRPKVMATDASHTLRSAAANYIDRRRTSGDRPPSRLLIVSIALLMVPVACFVLALVLLDGAPLKPISAKDTISIGAL